MAEKPDINQILGATLSAFHIKTPQLIGILAGCLVFVITIGVVFYLLYASGSFSKLAAEINGTDLEISKSKKQSVIIPQFSEQPELYEELLLARTLLPTKLCPPLLAGETVKVVPFNYHSNYHEVQTISDGRAVFHESAYDPIRLTGWLDLEQYDRNNQPTKGIRSESRISSLLSSTGALLDATHLCIVDSELSKIVGMIMLVDNCPRNLSIRIDNVWITPAFQGKKRAHEGILLVIQWLHKSGYRRITAEVEERHVIGRKFLERCGFQCEAILRKHKVLHCRNSNTALYVMLNSDFEQVERKLKTHLGLSLTAKMHKIAELESGKDVATGLALSHTPVIASVPVVESGKGNSCVKRNEKKKDKRKNKRNKASITW